MRAALTNGSCPRAPIGLPAMARTSRGRNRPTRPLPIAMSPRGQAGKNGTRSNIAQLTTRWPFPTSRTSTERGTLRRARKGKARMMHHSREGDRGKSRPPLELRPPEPPPPLPTPTHTFAGPARPIAPTPVSSPSCALAAGRSKLVTERSWQLAQLETSPIGNRKPPPHADRVRYQLSASSRALARSLPTVAFTQRLTKQGGAARLWQITTSRRSSFSPASGCTPTMDKAREAALSVLEYVHAHPEGSGEEHETAGKKKRCLCHCSSCRRHC